MTDSMTTRLIEDTDRHVLESLGVPKRVFQGTEDFSGLASTILKEREVARTAALRRWHVDHVIEPLMGDMIHMLRRVKHTSMGQEKRDFFRQMAKLSGIKQVKPFRIEWS